MSESSVDPPVIGRLVLLRALGLRYAVAIVLVAAILALRFAFDVAVPWLELSAGLAALLSINVLLHRRVAAGRPVTEREVFANVAVELLVLTALLHQVGGATSPLVSVFLLPVTMAANLLERRHTWAIALLAATCYTLLLAIDAPSGAHVHGDDGTASQFRLHVVGMWAIFVVSAGLVAHFVSSLAQSVRERDRRLASAREEALRSERIVALGTLAAGAAHELGTPLATMSVLAEDMARRHAGSGELTADLRDLESEIASCKRILSQLAESAGVARGESALALRADAFLERAVDRWQILRPEAHAELRWSGDAPAPSVFADRTLEQAMLNLLDNAADASPKGFAVDGRAEDGRVVIDILDDGPGLTDEARARAGEPFYSTKAREGGMGIGLFLANATIERFGGDVALVDRPGGGCCTRVTLPVLEGAA